MANQSDNTVGAYQAPDEATFACNLCPKTFTSWQALGGHQNAHRKERYAIKRMENERKMAQARQAHMERLLLPRPAPNNPAVFGWPAQFPAPPPAYGAPTQQLSASYDGVGGPGQYPEVVAGSSSSGLNQAEAEILDLTLKL